MKKLFWIDGKKTMTLEEYLKVEYDSKKAVTIFTLSLMVVVEDYVDFYVHPQGVDGATVNFTVRGNRLKQL